MKQQTALASAPVRALRRHPELPVTVPDIAPTPLKTLCSNCHLRDLCLPCGLEGSDVQRLDGLLFGRRRIRTGDTL